MTNTTNKQELIDSVESGIEWSDEEGLPTYFVICHSYTEHEEIITDELPIEEVVDELIRIINDYEPTEDDLYLTIDGYWEETEVLDTLHTHDLQETN